MLFHVYGAGYNISNYKILRFFMKKILLIGLICITAILNAGCVRFSYDIKIDNKDRISIVETAGVKYFPLDTEAFKESVLKDMSNIITAYKKAGCEVELSKSIDDFHTMKLTRKGLSFAEASKTLPKGFQADDKAFTVKRTLLKRYYRIHLVYNIQNAASEAKLKYINFKAGSKTFALYKEQLGKYPVSAALTQNSSDGEYLVTKTYADGNTIISKYNPETDDKLLKEDNRPYGDLTIKIPSKATKNNADKVISSTEYHWYFPKDGTSKEIILEYEKSDFTPLVMVISMILLFSTAFAIKRKAESGGPVQGL